MAKKKTSIADLMSSFYGSGSSQAAPATSNTTSEQQAVIDDYNARQWGKAATKNTLRSISGNKGPNPFSLFESMSTIADTNYLKGVKPSQLSTVTRPPSRTGTTTTTTTPTSNTSTGGTVNTAPLPTPQPNAPSYVGSNDWADIVGYYFPKGAGTYKKGGKVEKTQSYASGGLVRGGGAAQRGRGRGRIV